MSKFLTIIGIILLVILVLAIAAIPYILVWVTLPISIFWKSILTVMLMCFYGCGIRISYEED